jgi:hypothetical protein
MNMTAMPIGGVGPRCTRERGCMVAAMSYSQVCTALDPRQGVPAPGTPELQKESVRQAIEIICIQRSETKLLDPVEKTGNDSRGGLPAGAGHVVGSKAGPRRCTCTRPRPRPANMPFSPAQGEFHVVAPTAGDSLHPRAPDVTMCGQAWACIGKAG